MYAYNERYGTIQTARLSCPRFGKSATFKSADCTLSGKLLVADLKVRPLADLRLSGKSATNHTLVEHTDSSRRTFLTDFFGHRWRSPPQMKMNPGASQWAPKKPSPLDHMLQMADLTADAGTGKNVKSASGQTLKSATRKVYSLQISKSQICQISDSLLCSKLCVAFCP